MPGPDPAAGTFGVLVRLFFSRFFDKESLSPQGDASTNVVQTLGILAAPGIFISLFLWCFPLAKSGWGLVMVRCLFLWVSMVVTAFIVVFEWDALFLDRRDYQVLLPLPLPLWKVFLAKMAAFLLFPGLFLAAINGAAAVLWPAVFDIGNYPEVLAVHLLIIAASGLFSAFAAASIQGLLLIAVPAKFFRPVATCVQTVLMTALVMLFFLTPLAVGLIETYTTKCVPPYWFVGLYEQVRPAVGSHALPALGGMALPGLGCAFAAFALTHLPGYRWQMRRLIETPPSSPSGPGWLHASLNAAVDRLVLKNPVQRAVFHFISQTISRSMKHRLFLAVYAGFGAALVVFNVPGFPPDRTTLLGIPLMLSFVLISGLRAAFSFPAELNANWGFQITDSNHATDCMHGVRKWIIVRGMVPLFLLLALAELQFLPWTIVLFQTCYGVMLSLLLTEVMFIGFRKIPFTCGYFPGRMNLVFFGALYVGSLTLYSSSMMTDLEARLMNRPLNAVALFCMALGAWFKLWNWRDDDGDEMLDYLGDMDPAVRTLGLTPH